MGEIHSKKGKAEGEGERRRLKKAKKKGKDCALPPIHVGIKEKQKKGVIKREEEGKKRKEGSGKNLGRVIPSLIIEETRTLILKRGQFQVLGGEKGKVGDRGGEEKYSA